MRLPKKKFLVSLIGIVLIIYCVINYNYIYSPTSAEHSEHEAHDHQHAHDHGHQHGHDHEHNKPAQDVNNGKNKIVNNQTEINKNLNSNVATNKPKSNVTRRLLAYDGGGFGAVPKGIATCRDNTEIEVTDDASRLDEADISYYHMQVPPKRDFKKPHYSMVYTLESEPHSYGGETWDNADFRMWYNLDLSHPEPATYFDVRTHLADLLAPPHVEFEKKTDEGLIAWIVSNCNAFNGREKYMKRLMDLVKVDSYGGCLKNKFTHTSDRMRGNIELFSRYKFVIAIENSNCQDYITEKLVHAVASGSIPIVAGKDNKPNYLKFMPKNSYINLYDYKSPEQVARHIKLISQNKTLYESYFPFKRHMYSKEYLKKLSLPELIELAKKVMSPDEKMFSELVAKEKSENKICKIARYILNTDQETIKKEVNEKRRKRPATTEACLPSQNLDNDFNSGGNNNIDEKANANEKKNNNSDSSSSTKDILVQEALVEKGVNASNVK